MNFGWDLTTPGRPDHGAARDRPHAGHAARAPEPVRRNRLGRAEVYAYFGGPPNYWDRDKTFDNVLASSDQRGRGFRLGSRLDHGVLVPRGPDRRAAAVPSRADPPGTISEHDSDYFAGWYPRSGHGSADDQPFESVPLKLQAGDQADCHAGSPGNPRLHDRHLWSERRVLVLFEEVVANFATWRPTTTPARIGMPGSR